MAFDANINLNLDNSKALKGVNDVEKAVKRLEAATDKIRLKVEGASEAEQAATKLYKALERLENAALSKLPRSVQLLVAYLKAANSGMAQLSARAALAAAGIGGIGRINFAPLVRQLNQVKDLMFEIQQVQIKFLDAPTGFRPRLGGTTPFQPLLDGLDLVRVRVVDTQQEIANLYRLAGGGGAGGGPPRLPPGIFSDGAAGQPNRGGRNSVPVNSLRGLEASRRALENLYRSAEIGSDVFRNLSNSIDQVNEEVRRAELFNPQNVRRRRDAARQRLEERRERRNRRVGGIATGVGFSALFGGGLGEIIGGGIGAAGGLGGSLIGSVLGRALDDLGASAVKTADLLRTPIKSFEELAKASVFTSREEEKRVRNLIKLGKSQDALAVIEERLVSSVGREGLQDFQALEQASDKLNRSFAELALQIQAVIAGPLGELLRLLANAVGREAKTIQNIRNRSNVIDQLSPDDLKEFRKQEKELITRVTREGLPDGKSLSDLTAELAQSFAKESTGSILQLDPEQRAKAAQTELEATQKRVQGIKQAFDLVQNFTRIEVDAVRQKEDLERQRYDLIRSNEKAIANLRQSVETKIANIRLQNLARENQLLDAQADIRRKQLENSLIGFSDGFENSEVANLASGISEFLQAELDAAERAAKLKRDTALEVKRIEVQTEQFKLRVAQQVAGINEASAERIAEINRNVRRANEDAARRNFELEKQLAVLRLDAIRIEAEQARLAAVDAEDFGGAVQQQQLIDQLIDAKARLQAATAPAAQAELAGVPAAGASTSGVEALNETAIDLLQNIGAAKQSLIDLASQGNLQQLQTLFDNTFVTPFKLAEEKANSFINNISAGYTLVQAEFESKIRGQLADVDKLIDKITSAQIPAELKDYLVKLLEGGKTDLANNSAAAERAVFQAEALKDLVAEEERLTAALNERTTVERVLNDLTERGIALDSDSAQALIQRAEAIDKLKEIAEAKQLFEDIATVIGQGITDALSLVISGTEDLGEALKDLGAQILETIGQMLILKAIEAGVDALSSTFFKAPGKLPKFAEGGRPPVGAVSIVGERGPELFVPDQPGRIISNRDSKSAMARYTPANSIEELAMQGGGRGKSEWGYSTEDSYQPVINISTGNTLQFEGRNYVTQEEFQAGVSKAAIEGAKAGEARTLRRLRMSPGSRRNVGL